MIPSIHTIRGIIGYSALSFTSFQIFTKPSNVASFRAWNVVATSGSFSATISSIIAGLCACLTTIYVIYEGVGIWKRNKSFRTCGIIHVEIRIFVKCFAGRDEYKAQDYNP